MGLSRLTFASRASVSLVIPTNGPGGRRAAGGGGGGGGARAGAQSAIGGGYAGCFGTRCGCGVICRGTAAPIDFQPLLKICTIVQQLQLRRPTYQRTVSTIAIQRVP